MTEITGKLQSRKDLIKALQFASVLEHTLCCEYLFTGFSMRRSLADYPTPKDDTEKRQFQAAIDQVRPWQTQIYFIARQEMEHLAIATNLLAALGEPPFLKRPQFPVERKKTLLDAPFCLERFNTMSMKTYIWFERPTYLTSSFPENYLNRCGEKRKKGLKLAATLKEVHDAVEQFGITSVEELYNEINTAFQELKATDLFQGDTEQQVGDIFGYKVYMKTITNRVEAAEAIQLIIEQGEGIGLDPLSSDAHFQRFTDILTEYENWLKDAPDGVPEPGLPVLLNPLTETHKTWTGKSESCFNCAPNVIERESTLEMMRYFNESYNLMMVMLYDFFDLYRTPNPPATAGSGEQSAKFYAAFFPMMTMVIRPLGEMLARLPAGDEYPNENAGVSFEIDNELLDLWPTLNEKQRLKRYLAWMKDLRNQAKEMSKDPERYVDNDGDQVVLTAGEFQHQMQFMAENIHSTRLHLRKIWRNKYE